MASNSDLSLVPSVSSRVAALRVVTATILASCTAAPTPPAPPTPATTLAGPAVVQTTEPYRAAGFLVGDGLVPFVGMVRFLGTESADTTMMLVALSIPPRLLSFVRAGDRYAAYYAVKIDVMSGQTLVRSERPSGEVRVASFQETVRGDQGVIFQRTMRIAPGRYTIRVTAQDSLGAGTGTGIGPLNVPSLTSGSVAPMIPVFAAEPRPTRASAATVVINPRATILYGRDSTLQLYLEGYGPESPDTVILTTRPDHDPAIVLRRDTVFLPRGPDVRGALIAIPAARLGLGGIRISATRANDIQLGSIPAVITVGVDLPVTSVDELIDALKLYAADAELQPIRSAPPERRPALWSTFARQGDPNPSTPENEALLEYYRRLRIANSLYRDGTTPGWQTDRGAVVTGLGEADLMSEPVPADSAGVGRVMTWEYRRHRLLLVFTDPTGLGKWRLTPASDADFRYLLGQAGPCVGCR